VLPVFDLLSEIGNVPENEMHRTFNMGIGMVVITSPEDAEVARAHFDKRGDLYYDIGRIVEGSQTVSIVRK
jgi:phosphoribosylformylglycinamidine cyclo-ligase